LHQISSLVPFSSIWQQLKGQEKPWFQAPSFVSPSFYDLLPMLSALLIETAAQYFSE